MPAKMCWLFGRRTDLLGERGPDDGPLPRPTFLMALRFGAICTTV
jgi:hypothetical protein